MKGFDEKWLRDQGLVPDGNGGYRPMTAAEKEHRETAVIAPTKKASRSTPSSEFPLRKIELNLFGTPMPKQSVRAFVTEENKIGTFQPKEMSARKEDYIRQINKQLPADFVKFSRRVHIRKLHFVFPPLKSFLKADMARIERGEIIWKETKPDLPDNLKKLVMDAMSGLVYKDDNIIVSEDDVKKYYGTGGMIILELEGI